MSSAGGIGLADNSLRFLASILVIMQVRSLPLEGIVVETTDEG
jgi:hypothetical protein